MSYITYKQADSRWGRKNYNGSSTMATAGCGPTSVAMLAYAVDGKTDPWDVAKFMKKNGYAIRNNGTAWSGIPAAMKHFGLKDVKNVADMKDVWSYLSKGYCAVFLFRAGSRGGVTWTTSGHYVAVTAYKYKNKKHYLYTRDSGGRNHTGWYCYETQMRGLIPQIWVGKVGTPVKPKKPTGKYSGTIPKPTLKKGSKGAQVKYLQSFLNWYFGKKIAVDGAFGDITKSALEQFQNAEGIKIDGIYGKISQDKANNYKKKVTPTKGDKIAKMAKACAWPYGTKRAKYTYPTGKPMPEYKAALDVAYPDRSKWGKQTRAGASCDVFAGTMVRASGIDKKFPRGLAEQMPYVKKNTDKWTKVLPKSKSDLKAGDIMITSSHICVYVGGGYVCEAGYATKRYGCTNKVSSMYYTPAKYKNDKNFGVWRAK